jgi:predicted nucleotidyltransferase
MTLEAYARSKTFSEGKLRDLRAALAAVTPADVSVLTFGSYARREASENSDLDYLLIVEGDEPAEEPESASRIRAAISAHVPIDPGAGGPFGGHIASVDLLRNVGGNDDTNKAITRRILLLLEGDWLCCGDDSFRALRRSLIEKYVLATPPRDHQLALFLLNDIIRYWRTITVDYAFKIAEEGKDWGLRNIKLMYSRKLMYASGLFGVAMTADRSRDRKVEYLDSYFSLPVIERIITVAGETESRRLMELYNEFLTKLEQKSVRDHLKNLKRVQRGDPIFRELKNEGHRFTRELLNLFEKTFHSTHLIHRAVIF